MITVDTPKVEQDLSGDKLGVGQFGIITQVPARTSVKVGDIAYRPYSYQIATIQFFMNGHVNPMHTQSEDFDTFYRFRPVKNIKIVAE